MMAVISVMAAGHGLADPDDFKTGPVIDEFGPVATVTGAPLDAEAQFKVAFEVADAAEPGTLNRRLESVARSLNLHSASGVLDE